MSLKYNKIKYFDFGNGYDDASITISIFKLNFQFYPIKRYVKKVACQEDSNLYFQISFNARLGSTANNSGQLREFGGGAFKIVATTYCVCASEIEWRICCAAPLELSK